jgi:hypothetical protein
LFGELEMKLINVFFEILALLIGARSTARDEAVTAGVCDFSGQGRNSYGR